MSYVSLNTITQNVITLISQAGGTATQRYAQDRIQLIINCLHDTLIDRQWWPQYMQWYSLSLDEVNGEVVGDISAITRYADVRTVYYNNRDTELPEISSQKNPYGLAVTEPTYIGPSATEGKVFKIWPENAAGSIQFHARHVPARATGNDDIIKFDRLALELGAAWWYLEDDGTNPGASQKFQNMFEKRVMELEQQLQDKPTSLSGQFEHVPTQWWSR